MAARGACPPIDPLSSLSRLMRRGAGPGRTRPDHRDVAAQLLAAIAHARQVRELVDLIGESALGSTDRRYLDFEDRFYRQFVDQGRDEQRSFDQTLDRAWDVLAVLPRSETDHAPVESARPALGSRRHRHLGRNPPFRSIAMNFRAGAPVGRAALPAGSAESSLSPGAAPTCWRRSSAC
ncbi:ATP synthase beta subunit C-terminal domain-containing protein [Yinghuangia aomiensis]